MGDDGVDFYYLVYDRLYLDETLATAGGLYDLLILRYAYALQKTTANVLRLAGGENGEIIRVESCVSVEGLKCWMKLLAYSFLFFSPPPPGTQQTPCSVLRGAQ